MLPSPVNSHSHSLRILASSIAHSVSLAPSRFDDTKTHSLRLSVDLGVAARLVQISCEQGQDQGQGQGQCSDGDGSSNEVYVSRLSWHLDQLRGKITEIAAAAWENAVAEDVGDSEAQSKVYQEVEREVLQLVLKHCGS